MASIQSKLIAFMIRRMRLFEGDTIDYIATRTRWDAVSSRSKSDPRVPTTPVQAGAVPSVWFVPAGALPGRAVLYLHGGAWFMGSVHTHKVLIAELARACGVRILAINYRLAPENPFPAGLEDCLSAYNWLQANICPASQIVVAGDSAGGNLALAMLLHLRDAGEPLPACVVGLSPATDLAMTGASHTNRKRLDPFFHRSQGNSIMRAYLGENDPRQPLISPLYGDLQGLPPVLLHVGDREILLDDSLRFVEKACTAGVDARLVVWPGMFHVFQAAGSLLPEARRSIAQIAAFIQERLDAPA